MRGSAHLWTMKKYRMIRKKMHFIKKIVQSISKKPGGALYGFG